MSKNKQDGFFDMFTQKGNKEEEEEYEAGTIILGIMAAISMTLALVAIYGSIS